MSFNTEVITKISYVWASTGSFVKMGRVITIFFKF
jgi:hypothetical protein